MITYVNNSNAEQYRVLYAKATADLMSHNSEGQKISPGGESALGLDSITPIQGDAFGQNGAPDYEPYTFYVWNESTEQYELSSDVQPKAEVTYYQAPDITSLNEYFSYITALARIDKVYTVLPLDEETFNIDANTREIKVPDHFAKNGISVQGDEIAEVIYFKINRYFDTIDLAKKDIYIQWRSAGIDEATGQLMEGVSVPWCIDLNSEPNYIIFGWPISSKITAAAGEIAFAVRFYEFNDETNKIDYSLSTLTQRVTIKPSLDFGILDKFLEGKGLAESTLVIDDNNNLILSRLVDSDTDGQDEKALPPYFLLRLNPENMEPVIENGVQTVETWLDTDNEGFRTVPIDVFVQATSDDGGRISYSWIAHKLDNTPLAVTDSGNAFKPTEDTSRNPSKSYWINTISPSNDDGWKLYKDNIFDPDDPDYPENGIYERYSRMKIFETGKYYVVITNRVKNSTARIESYMLMVKPPVKPVIDTNLQATGVLKPNENSEDNYKLTLSVVASSSDQAHSKKTYQWQIMAPGTNEWVDIEGANEAEYVIDGSADRIDGSAVGRVGDGKYKVIVYNNLNKEVKYEESETTRVTHEASKPIITIEGRTTFNQTEAARDGLSLTSVAIDTNAGEDRTEDDSVTYQWYKYKTGTSGRTTEEDKDAADAGTYEFDNDIIQPDAAGLVSEGTTFYPTSTGHYYCMVKNTYNGTEATQISRFFVVTDA